MSIHSFNQAVAFNPGEGIGKTRVPNDNKGQLLSTVGSQLVQSDLNCGGASITGFIGGAFLYGSCS